MIKIKKYFVLVLLFLSALTLYACKKNTDELLIMIPSGTPSLMVANMLDKPIIKNHQVKYDLVNGSEPLIAAFTAKTHDIIFAPTNLGLNLYNKLGNYVLVGVPIWGNNYIIAASEKNINSLADLAGKRIFAFGLMSTPDAVLQIILSENNLLDKVQIEYAPDVTTSTTYFLNGLEDIVLTAEPMLTKASRAKQVTIIDLQEEWEKLTTYKGYPQVGIFVRTDIAQNNKLLIAYLNALENEITYMNTNKTDFANKAIAADEQFALLGLDNIVQSIPRCNYRLMRTALIKNELLYYFNVLLAYNANLIGGSLPDEGFYKVL